MRLLRGFSGVKGFPAAAALVPPGKTAWERGCAVFYGWVWPTISKRAWDWSFGGLTKRGAHSLDMAILAIGIPPVLFFIALFLYVRRRNRDLHGVHGAGPDLDSGAPEQASSRTRA